MKIAIGSDHAGFDLKEFVKARLNELGHDVEDKGTHSAESVDYPDFAHTVAREVTDGKVIYGIVICGSGNGVAMSANKHKGIRCALCWEAEIAALARKHNDANVLALPARFISEAAGAEMVEIFLETAFEGGRHERRVHKISE